MIRPALALVCLAGFAVCITVTFATLTVNGITVLALAFVGGYAIAAPRRPKAAA